MNSFAIVFSIFIFFFGAMIGSFLNVIIYRIPREKSIVTPRSACPSCSTLIKWFDNIPVFSYFVLRGKCRKCKTKISIRYPLIELFVGAMCVYFFPKELSIYNITIFAFYFSCFCVFVCHFFIDIDFQILPDGLNLYLAAIFLAYSLVFSTWQHWVLGGFVGFIMPFLLTYGFYKLKGKIGMGGGDIKLFAALGIYLGPIEIFNTFFLSSVLGTLVMMSILIIKKGDKNIPFAFGPFIIIAASMQIFFKDFLAMISFSLF